MSETKSIYILPYSKVVGQKDLKLALELAYIAPRIGGVLISGHRGTGKSTTVRAFAKMMYGKLPITLPINATEDRVIGTWDIYSLWETNQVAKTDQTDSTEQPETSEHTNDEKTKDGPRWKNGLVVDAHERILYVDEVNLLDDHIVNIILDVAASGFVEAQREGYDGKPQDARFTLVGTMNPEEGLLRPQLLDRFGLMANIKTESDREKRAEILRTVLALDKALEDENPEQTEFFKDGYANDEKLKNKLVKAKESIREQSVTIAKQQIEQCVKLAEVFDTIGHRTDYTLAMAAQACAAKEGKKKVTKDHIKRVAPLALAHRRGQNQEEWAEEDDNKLEEQLKK